MENELKQYLNRAFSLYRNDPADTDFQKGYLAALIEIAKVLCHSADYKGLED